MHLPDRIFRLPRRGLSLSRKGIYLSLFACLLFPVLFVADYKTQGNEGKIGWVITAALAAGAAAGWALLNVWEKKMRCSVGHLVEQKLQRLQKSPPSFSEKVEEDGSEYLEREVREYQKALVDLKRVVEKRGEYNHKLEERISYLTLEMKNLLEVDTGTLEIDHPLPASQLAPYLPTFASYDFTAQLQKYIERVESLTGVDHLGYIGGRSPRFLDIQMGSYAVDKRRLFDSFKDEGGGAVFVISLQEQQFVFVSGLIKSLVGWGPEKIMKDFPDLVAQGYPDWQQALLKLQRGRECATKFSLVNKIGQIVTLEGYMGRISRGPFARHALGLFVISRD